MASETHGSILLSTADSVSRMLMKKLDSQTGFKPSEWSENINLLGALPIRTASGTIAHFEDGADSVPMKSVVANIVPIQSGTGTPSPSNPRPISGTDELTLNHKDKNLLISIPENSKLLSSSGTTSSNSSYGTTDFFLLKAGTYTMSGKATETSSSASVRFRICAYQLDETFIEMSMNSYGGKTEGTIYSGSFTLANDSLVRVCGAVTSMSDFQLEVGSTATTYEAYKSETYTKALGQTVYCGTLDLVSGLLTLSRLKNVIDGTNENWTEYARDGAVVIYRKGNAVASIKDQLNQIANLFVFNENAHKVALQTPNTFVQGSSRHLFVQVAQSDFPTLSSFLTFLGNNNLEYIYDITPIEVQLPPQEVRTFLGVNNVYTDSGEVLDVEYRADMNLLIAELEN